MCNILGMLSLLLCVMYLVIIVMCNVVGMLSLLCVMYLVTFALLYEC